jgi:hypothetical protein
MKDRPISDPKARASMSLMFGSSKVRRDASEEDIRGGLAGQSFAILSSDDDTYIQCTTDGQPYGQYLLEYQQGSAHERYRASDPKITSNRVVDAFCKYLRGDESWRLDFRWEPIEG